MLEGVLQRLGVAVAHRGGKNTGSGSSGKYSFTTDLFNVSIVLPFEDCHTAGIIHTACKLFILASFTSKIHLSFLHAFSLVDSSFFRVE